jgi:hypothetical protein
VEVSEKDGHFKELRGYEDVRLGVAGNPSTVQREVDENAISADSLSTRLG